MGCVSAPALCSNCVVLKHQAANVKTQDWSLSGCTSPPGGLWEHANCKCIVLLCKAANTINDRFCLKALTGLLT